MPSPEMQRCIDHCLACYSTCLSMAMRHCLDGGGKRGEPAHLRMLFACAGNCRNSAHVLLFDLQPPEHTCTVCADICEECARDCERIGGMDECVSACRTCAESCRAVAAESQLFSLGAGSMELHRRLSNARKFLAEVAPAFHSVKF